MPNLYSVGLFTSANGQTIASTEKTVITTGYSLDGVGAETYAYDSTLTGVYLAKNPRTSFAAADGRIFKLAPMSKPLATAFGALVHPTPPGTAIQTANSQAIQAAMRWGPFLLPPGTIWCNASEPIIPWTPAEPGVPAGSGTIHMEGTGIKGTTNASLIRWVVGDSQERPCIFIPEGYINGRDNKLYKADGTLYDTTTAGPPTGRQVIFKNVQLIATYGRYATVMFLVDTTNNYFEGCNFGSTHRGLMDVSSFNTVFSNCSFTGLYYNAGRTLNEVESQFRESYGLYTTGHFTVLNSSFTGWGVGISCGGPSSTIMNTRMEVGECAVRLGGATNYYWEYWNGSTWTGGNLVSNTLNFDSCAFESNRWGVIAENVTGSQLSKLAVTGSGGAVPLGRAPAAGIVVDTPVNISTVFDNCNVSVLDTIYGPIINAGTAEWRRATNLRGAQAAWSASAARWRITQSTPNLLKDDKLAADRSLVTCDSQMALRGITGFDGANALVFSNNVGSQNVTVPTSAASVAIAFPTAKGTGTAQFTSGPIAVADGSSTLAPATYWYATTILGRRGETGVNWRPLFEGSSGTDLTYKNVVIASGQRVDMSWNSAGAGYFRRVYRGTKSGYFDGFWEFPGTQTSFSDTGSVIFNGQDFPPGVSGFIPAQAEVDTGFGIVLTPNWNTSYWITGKSNTGFTVNFGTPAPAGATFDWLLYRG